MEGSEQSTLRAKYLDWCSAQLADRFLELTPEEIYELARPTEQETGGLPHPSNESYRVVVQRVTDVLLDRIPLPSFEQWTAAYAEEPERFEAELLGFWRDSPESAAGGGMSAGGEGG